MKEALVETTTFNLAPLSSDNQEWITKWEIIKFDWFMKVYLEWKDDDDEKDDKQLNLPDIKIWTQLPSKELNWEQKFSRPPARYTEASLVKKLESEWIGRPSTYAPTISTIIDRGYIEKFDKRYLMPTEIAFVVVDFLEKYFNQMMDYKFTSKVEEDFDKISTWKEKYENMLSNFYENFRKDLLNADENAEKVVEKTWKQCPECKKELLMKFWKNGKFIACSGFPECKYTEEVDKEKNSELEEKFKDKKCTKCGSPMAVKHWRYWAFLGCSAYPECKTIEKIKDPKVEVLEELTKDQKCEKCESPMWVKNSRRWLFLWCTNYPECKNAKNIAKDIWEELNKRMEE